MLTGSQNNNNIKTKSFLTYTEVFIPHGVDSDRCLWKDIFQLFECHVESELNIFFQFEFSDQFFEQVDSRDVIIISATSNKEKFVFGVLCHPRIASQKCLEWMQLKLMIFFWPDKLKDNIMKVCSSFQRISKLQEIGIIDESLL